MADGHPDLSGVCGGPGATWGRGFAGGRGRGGRGGRGGPAPPTFTSLYTPAAAEAASRLDDDDDDPTLQCRDEVPPSRRGDSVGHWEGDVFVVDTRNFTDDTWMWAEGRVSLHSDQLRIVERYRRVDRNTLQIEATVYDPGVLTGPWTVPAQTLVLAPFDQIMPLVCAGS